MVVIIERDRRLARRLAGTLQRLGMESRLAHSYAQALSDLGDCAPRAVYVSEMLHRESGGDLLAAFDRDPRFAGLPAIVRVSHLDSMFARALRRGGVHTVVAPIDIEHTAALLVRMARGEEGALRRLIHQARELFHRTRANREAAMVTRRRLESLRHQARRLIPWR